MIIYLKRFVYISDPHPQARKIETEITFELDNLDISRLTTEGSQPPGAYSLVGTIQVEFSTRVFTYYKFIQHFGGIHTGHYISYALDPISKEWTQYNDQSTKAQMPSDQDAKSVYILFYRRFVPNVIILLHTVRILHACILYAAYDVLQYPQQY